MDSFCNVYWSTTLIANAMRTSVCNNQSTDTNPTLNKKRKQQQNIHILEKKSISGPTLTRSRIRIRIHE